jgi:hypothetical protein
LPKKKKPVHRMTTDELAEHVFGKKLKKKLQQMAHKPKGKRSS